jgi:hypothetical protein
MTIGKTIPPVKPKPIKLTVSREPRSDLQRDCINMLTTSDAKKITIELKPGVNILPAPAYGDMRVKFSIELLERTLMHMMLQHNDEIRVSVNATKVERNHMMVHGQILNTINNEQSAAKLRIGESSSTIPCLTD